MIITVIKIAHHFKTVQCVQHGVEVLTTTAVLVWPQHQFSWATYHPAHSRVCLGLQCITNGYICGPYHKQDRYVEIACHSCRLGGAGSVCFSPDGQTLVTAGLADGSLVCCRLRWLSLRVEQDAVPHITARGSCVLLSFHHNVAQNQLTLVL